MRTILLRLSFSNGAAATCSSSTSKPFCYVLNGGTKKTAKGFHRNRSLEMEAVAGTLDAIDKIHEERAAEWQLLFCVCK